MEVRCRGSSAFRGEDDPARLRSGRSNLGMCVVGSFATGVGGMDGDEGGSAEAEEAELFCGGSGRGIGVCERRDEGADGLLLAKLTAVGPSRL